MLLYKKKIYRVCGHNVSVVHVDKKHRQRRRNSARKATKRERDGTIRRSPLKFTVKLLVAMRVHSP